MTGPLASLSPFPDPGSRTLAQVDADLVRFGPDYSEVRRRFIRLARADRLAACELLRRFGVATFTGLRPGDIEQFDIALDLARAA